MHGYNLTKEWSPCACKTTFILLIFFFMTDLQDSLKYSVMTPVIIIVTYNKNIIFSDKYIGQLLQDCSSLVMKHIACRDHSEWQSCMPVLAKLICKIG